MCSVPFPSGIFQGNKVNIIGNGVVLDPALFKAEAEALEASGHPLKERLHISKKAHLILPTHRILMLLMKLLKEMPKWNYRKRYRSHLY